ncbi:MAG: AAA family ATPase [Candidatus Marinimicrobia bacterium]|nr:AAA family ATPase [Candidatus Neomarinimicrobiota bacterium]
MQGRMIQGQITRLYYASEEFCVGILETDTGQNIKFSTKFPVSLDERCKLKGSFKRHSKYGWQFEATGYELDIPVDREGLVRFLSESSCFKGIGRKRAEEIVSICNSGNHGSLGNNFEELIIKEPQRLHKLKGITPKITETLRKKWMETRDVNTAITILAGYDLTMNQISKVIKKYGSTAVHVVKENPYSLTDTIDGFGFRRADEIALKAGMKRDSKTRIHAGLIHIVKEELNEGHTWIEERELLMQAETVLQLSQLDADEIIQTHLDSLIHFKKLKCFSYHGTGVIALPHYFKMEEHLLNWLKSKHKKNDKKLLQQVEKTTMTKGQKEAFIGAMENSQYLISGPAGSGKTFTVNQLVEELKKQELSVILCAPTGKAARRMEEVCGMPASTIHRLLGFDGIGFNHHGDNKLITDVIIIDECSMIDVWLFYHLMDAIDLENTKIIFAGDHNQLPPVGAGNVLRDILQQHLIPFTILSEVVRQAGTLKKNSLKILDGVVHGTRKTDSKSTDWIINTRYDNHIDLINGLITLYKDILPLEYDDLIRDVQVLSPMKKTDVGVIHLNRILQQFLQKKVYGRDITSSPKGSFLKLHPGDKVIQTKNDYKLGVMNGHMGIVIEADYHQKKFIIEFENNGALEIAQKNMKNISLAYCLTVHKVQGSEFPCVITVMHSSHYIMLHQNLIYTSVSRAKNQSYILGDMRGIKKAAKNKQVDKRRTFLSLMGENR